MLYKDDDGFYYCSAHKYKLEWCENKSNGTFFLRCPDITNGYGLECGTVKLNSSELHLYDQFAPNRDLAIVDYVSELINADDERERF